MPYLTGFLLIAAGMMFGYILTYRDRVEELQQRSSLERDNQDLRTSIAIVHRSHSHLEERFQSQQNQLAVLQQLSSDQLVQFKESESLRVNQGAEIERLNTELTESKSRLTILSQQADSDQQSMLQAEQRLVQSIHQRDAALDAVQNLKIFQVGIECRSRNQESTIRRMRQDYEEQLPASDTNQTVLALSQALKNQQQKRAA